MRSNPYTAPVLVLAALAAACAPVTSLDGDTMALRSDDFRRYVESVFRRQNAIASEIALILDAPALSASAVVTLETAEADLLAACAGINELATRQQRGQSAGGLRAARAARRVPQCEAATHAAEDAYARVADGL